jgi:hypothetical protein
MKCFNLIFLFLVLNYLSIALNVSQTLNGLVCFSQVFTTSHLSAANVVSLSVPYGSSNINLQDFCRGGKIKHYDNNNPIGYVTNCTVRHGKFSCHSRSIDSKPIKETSYGCDCNAGSKSDDPVNLIITRESIFQTFNGSITENNVQCNASVRVGQCSLNSGFYTLFSLSSSALIFMLFLISFCTNSNTKCFENLILTFGQSTKMFQKYGFISYCDWSVGGRSYCRKKEGYEFVPEGRDRNFTPTFSTFRGFYNITRIDGTVSKFKLDICINSCERRLNIELDDKGVAMLSYCLMLILKGKKIHHGDHFLSIDEIVSSCSEGKKLSVTDFEGFLYGSISLFDKLMLHSKCFFGFFRRDAVDKVLKHNIKNPCPGEIKSSEWKMYLSDVNFHIGLRRSSRLKRFEPSKGYKEYLINLEELKPGGKIMLNEKESEIVEDCIVKESLNEVKKCGVNEKKGTGAEDVVLDTDSSEEVGWVKNYDDLKPNVYKSDSSEVQADKDKFIIYEGEAVRRLDGQFNFKKSYLDVLKTDIKKGFRNIMRGGIIEPVPYRHKNLEYKRVCSHGLATKNLSHFSKLRDYQKIGSTLDLIKENVPMIKRVVYGNHKPKDIEPARNLKNKITQGIEISPNPFELTDLAPELNYFLIEYSLSCENKTLFFLPSDGEAINRGVKMDVMKKNMEEVEDLISKGKFDDLKKMRKKTCSKWSRRKKSRKKKSQGKKCQKYGHIDFKFEDERPDIKRVVKTCLKKSAELDKLYDKSLSFCKKLHNHILNEAESGMPLLSSNNMRYRGLKFKKFGLSNKVLSHLYKGCIEKEPCFHSGYCMNQENATASSLFLHKIYEKGYSQGNTVMGVKMIIENHFNELFFGKINLDRFLDIEI